MEAIRNWPQPATINELQSFLGFANFYQRFIHKCSLLSSPLTSTQGPAQVSVLELTCLRSLPSTPRSLPNRSDPGSSQPRSPVHRRNSVILLWPDKISSLNLGCSRVRLCKGLICFLWSCPDGHLGQGFSNCGSRPTCGSQSGTSWVAQRHLAAAK